MAAGRIKGITIEIGGDTTGLTKALSSVDKQLSTTKSNLRDVNKLLKLDPGNTELLTQKQKNLEGAISATKKRLDELKSVNKDAVTPEQWDGLQREIIDTEQKLKGLEKEYKSFGSVASQQVQAVGGKISSVGQSITGIGVGMTKYVTGPIVAAGAAAGMAWQEVDSAMDIIVTKTGASGEALTDMQDRAKNMAETIPTSFEEAATAIGEVNTRFGLTGESLEALSTQFVQFSSINSVDLNSAIDSVQSSMAAFGISTDEAGLVLDALNVAGQNTGVNVLTLAESLQTNSVALQEMGFNITDSITFLSELDKAGVDSSTVMSGLKKALANATAEGKTMDEALAEIQDSMVNATSDTEAMQIATELFGEKAGAAIATYSRNGQLDFNALGQSAEDFAGSVNQTYEDTMDPMDEMTIAMNTAKDVGYEIGEAAAPLITSALKTVSGIVKDLKDKWDSLSPEQQKAILTFVSVAAAIGPVVTIIGGVITGIGGVVSAIGTLMPIITGTVLPIIASTGPIVLGIGAIIALGTAIVMNWETIKKTATDVWNGIKETVGGAIDKIKGFLDFKWEFPHIDLPHFSISGSVNPLDWISQGPPRLSVEWYAKAYDNPVLFTSPTVLPTLNGYKGFGEGSGAEIVMSLNKLREVVGGASGETIINVYAQPGQDVRSIARAVQQEMARAQKQKGAAGL